MGARGNEREVIDSDALEALAQSAAGDASARDTLILRLWPHWVWLVKAHRGARGQEALDDLALDVATRMAEKMCRADARMITQFASWKGRNPEKTFADWVRISTINELRDHLRGRLRRELGGRLGHPSPLEGVSYKGLLNEFSRHVEVDDVGERPAVTPALMAVQIMVFARGKLPPQQLAALERWLQGETFDDIARELNLADEGAAQRLLRAAVAVLRRQFTGVDG